MHSYSLHLAFRSQQEGRHYIGFYALYDTINTAARLRPARPHYENALLYPRDKPPSPAIANANCGG
jgi:hypothetical protein